MDEKSEEKEISKQDEKSPEEKNYYGEKDYDEKYRRDPLSSIVWAAILIWAGLVFMANNLGMLDQFQPILDALPTFGESWDFTIPFVQAGAFQLFLFGVILILIVEILIRLVVPEYRRPIFGSVVFLGVVISIAFDNWEFFFPLLLIAFGASILMRRR